MWSGVVYCSIKSRCCAVCVVLGTLVFREGRGKREEGGGGEGRKHALAINC